MISSIQVSPTYVCHEISGTTLARLKLDSWIVKPNVSTAIQGGNNPATYRASTLIL